MSEAVQIKPFVSFGVIAVASRSAQRLRLARDVAEKALHNLLPFLFFSLFLKVTSSLCGQPGLFIATACALLQPCFQAVSGPGITAGNDIRALEVRRE